MKVLKFGGTSVGSADRMKHVLYIINHQIRGRKIVVLSAMSGTTDKLKHLVQLVKKQDELNLEHTFLMFKKEYIDVVHELFEDKEYLRRGKAIIEAYFDDIYVLLHKSYSPQNEKIMLAHTLMRFNFPYELNVLVD